MLVKELMKQAQATSAPNCDLAAVIEAMRVHQCGFVPVIDSDELVVGVVTDRDICLAAGRKDRPVGRLSVSETMSRPVFSGYADDDVKVVLVTMAKHRVRRLPVLTKAGRLAGVLSMDDVVSAPTSRDGPTAEDILTALRAINAPRDVETVPG